MPNRHRRALHALIVALACLGWGLGIITIPLVAGQHQLALSDLGSVALGLTCGTVALEPSSMSVWLASTKP